MKASQYDLLNIPPQERKAVLLQSGGLDSCYMACMLNYYGFEVHSVFIDYGQNSISKELECAKEITKFYGGTLDVVKLSLPWLKNVCLLNGGKAVSRPDLDPVMGGVKAGIYVPMRNLLFLTIASSYAESYKVPYIVTGIDGLQDKEGNPLHGTPDKHPNFALKVEQALNESSAFYHIDGNNFELICPLLGYEKEQTIIDGFKLDCHFDLSWTCYNDSEKPCLKCDSCLQRAWAFENLGYKDPLLVKYYGDYTSLEELLNKCL